VSETEAGAGRQGPLVGLRVLELTAIGPVPFAGGLLADLGADVLRIEAPGPQLAVADEQRAVHLRGRSPVTIDLRNPAGVAVARDLAARADVLLEGYRPGVLERLGLAPADLQQANPGLIIGRMTGWGQSGPLAQRAGHDIDYIAVAGALRHFAREGERPVPPVNLVGDFGGGAMFLVTGVLAALWERTRSGRGQVIDAAMVDGVAYLMMLVHSMAAQGMWRPDAVGGNLLDTGAPFYDVYECADGQYLAVGCLEPKFYAEFLVGAGLADADLPAQYDIAGWPVLRRVFADRLRERSRDDWEAVFDGTDACVAGVRTAMEAARHPHLVARATFLPDEPLQPAPAPRFSRTPGRAVPRGDMVHGAAALTDWGIAPDIAAQITSGAQP
jgi:alpha-methylacyl-CoA racemase